MSRYKNKYDILSVCLISFIVLNFIIINITTDLNSEKIVKDKHSLCTKKKATTFNCSCDYKDNWRYECIGFSPEDLPIKFQCDTTIFYQTYCELD